MLVDDHFAMLMGLRACLKPETDMTVVAEATDGQHAIDQYRLHQPGVTLMDLRLPRLSGVEAIVAIRHEFPEARIIALTTREGDEDIHRALSAGARSYLTKNMPRQEILTAIRSLHQGQDYLPEGVQARLQQGQDHARLSPREQEVLHHLGRGRSNKEIATALAIAEITVKIHVSHLFAKMGVLDRSQAMVEGLRRGLIHLDDT